jgi:antitoxin Xre/MbcA/ParS-like protein
LGSMTFACKTHCSKSRYRLYLYQDNGGIAMAGRVARRTEADENPKGPNTAQWAPANRRRLSSPGLRTFLAIADLWGLNEEQRLLILGYPSRSTYHHWCKLARQHGSFTLDVDTLTRISAVLGIHQALNILFANERLGVAWLRGPHQAAVFGGRPPLDLVTSGSQDALLTVRRFLDGARGGAYMQPNALDADFAPYTDEDLVLR